MAVIWNVSVTLMIMDVLGMKGLVRWLLTMGILNVSATLMKMVVLGINGLVMMLHTVGILTVSATLLTMVALVDRTTNGDIAACLRVCKSLFK
jgi:hypothetical protein